LASRPAARSAPRARARAWARCASPSRCAPASSCEWRSLRPQRDLAPRAARQCMRCQISWALPCASWARQPCAILRGMQQPDVVPDLSLARARPLADAGCAPARRTPRRAPRAPSRAASASRRLCTTTRYLPALALRHHSWCPLVQAAGLSSATDAGGAARSGTPSCVARPVRVGLLCVWQGCRCWPHDTALTPRCTAQEIVEELVIVDVRTRCGRSAKRLRLA